MGHASAVVATMLSFSVLVDAVPHARSPPPPPEIHLQNCRDERDREFCRSSAKTKPCTDPIARRFCARSCGTCSRLVAPVQVGTLMDGVLPIPREITTVLLEIGSSDRNTMDVEVLPSMPEAFLVTAEPLIEKYARALGRRKSAEQVKDALEPLGQHHHRGIVLPMAVAPTPGAESGEMRDLNVREKAMHAIAMRAPCATARALCVSTRVCERSTRACEGCTHACERCACAYEGRTHAFPLMPALHARTWFP